MLATAAISGHRRSGRAGRSVAARESLAAATHDIVDPADAEGSRAAYREARRGAEPFLFRRRVCGELRLRPHAGAFSSPGRSLGEAAFLSARNDVLANAAIIAAGSITSYTFSTWPDLIVGLGFAAINAGAARDVWEAARGTPGCRGLSARGEAPMDGPSSLLTWVKAADRTSGDTTSQRASRIGPAFRRPVRRLAMRSVLAAATDARRLRRFRARTAGASPLR